MSSRRPVFLAVADARRKTMRAASSLAAASLAVAALPGCVDRAALSRFAPLSTNTFEYAASTTLFYRTPIDSWGEEQRLAWLETWLDLHGLCPGGYVITSREVVHRYASPLGYPVDDIFYHGRCSS
jgi:hypothetical protein